MKTAFLLLCALVSIWGLVPVFAQETETSSITGNNAAAPAPVVLELFTSQGCAFCPPADTLMDKLAAQPGIIGLSCHVDYFGVRKNSLGKSFCTQRQLAYNRLIGTGPRYTPQLVVNGHLDVIGYEADKVSAAIFKARSEKITAIPIAAAGNGNYTFSLPAGVDRAGAYNLWLAIYDAPHAMAITEGNNFGKTVRYVNVVSQMQDLGAWDGAAIARTLMPQLTAQNAGFAVIAQNVRTGYIVAAGSLSVGAPAQTLSMR